jgi:hypothetical protein
MMHRIASQLPEYDRAFTPYFADGLLRRLVQAGMLEYTILAGAARARASPTWRPRVSRSTSAEPADPTIW